MRSVRHMTSCVAEIGLGFKHRKMRGTGPKKTTRTVWKIGSFTDMDSSVAQIYLDHSKGARNGSSPRTHVGHGRGGHAVGDRENLVLQVQRPQILGAPRSRR